MLILLHIFENELRNLCIVTDTIDVVDVIFNNISESLTFSGEALDSSIANSIVNTIENVIIIQVIVIQDGSENQTSMGNTSDISLNILNNIGQLLLNSAKQGENIIIGTNALGIDAGRFSINDPFCPSNFSNIILPQEYGNNNEN